MVKIGNPANYTVQVFPDEWEAESPEEEARFAGIFSVALNLHGLITFVPGVPADPPPLAAARPPREDEFTTAAEVRWCELLNSPYSVTPDDTRAGTVGEVGSEESPATVFYVTGEEFAAFTTELWELAEIASGGNPRVRRDELLDRAVIRFIEDRVVGSGRLRPEHAASLGRAG
ncbi:hypothetical protein [Actinoplanes regularis]|uniref:Uncharacterized protein n=1 Tax=Actinoplanes regularis TaxID=52697 RepID=A0A238WLZ3_9ACTN|nr:hypothetical protein [Actinoplanes regularis]GIE84738.1 hypothetical protein Are01nite_12180 [Actinoplanes regularis]GLW32358.1 hypothetical protein Areg01_52970 [Actinoplanes regularis]SNR47590.1 hypothetical protein SAMN06264365_102685 [Actinoplanes regularis]